jgi:pSer/pThr/pTyr-binding forkhead associated (FHA) protein
VSRRHVLIIREGNLLKVADLGSTNGTYLNGVRLQQHQPRLLRTGDRLSLGELVLKVSSLI